MNRQTTIVLGALALVVVVSAGYAWYARTTAEPERRQAQQQAPPRPVQPEEDPIPELSEEEWPYERPAEHLYIQKGITLDPEVIQINNELKDVTLCGTTYKTKQVMIDGVDVVQRFSELLNGATTTTREARCSILLRELNWLGGHIGANNEMQIVIEKSDPTNPDYVVSISVANSLHDRLGNWLPGLGIWISASKNIMQSGNGEGPSQLTGTLR